MLPVNEMSLHALGDHSYDGIACLINVLNCTLGHLFVQIVNVDSHWRYIFIMLVGLGIFKSIRMASVTSSEADICG